MDELDERNTFDSDRVKKKLFMYLSHEISVGIQKFPKNIDLKLMSSHINVKKLGNQFKAVFELMNCQLCSPSNQQKFIIFKGKIDI